MKKEENKKPHEVEDICPNCHGEGYTSQYHSYPCRECGGTGKIIFTEVGKIYEVS